MDPISLAIMGGLGLGKMIVGAVQKSKANKELKKPFPRYTRPEEYNKLLSIYQQQANVGQLPGQERYEAALSERTARGARAIGKFADSPIAAVAATMGLYGREQQAIRDLGLQFANFKTSAQQQLAGAYQVGMQEAGKEFSYNQWYPAQVQKNIAAQRWNAGQQNLWGGLDMLGATAMYGVDAWRNRPQGPREDIIGVESPNAFNPMAPSLSPISEYNTKLAGQ